MKRELIIDKTVISDTSPCYVIAELGHNHQGNVQTAKEMIRVAKESGAHAVKLQKRDNKHLFTAALYNAPYDNENSYGPTYGAHREALEFGKAEYQELISYARSLDISLFATPFDFQSADFLAELEVPAYKIASADLNNLPLQKHVAALQKPIFLSTGGGSISDVKRACDTILPINPNLCLLQCTAAYPISDYKDMNLRVISTFRETFPDLVIGLSDHESGITMAVVAYMLGARVVEKHFTLNRAWRGTDHAFSLSPTGLRSLVRNLEKTQIALGDGVKKRLSSEEKPLFKMSKKLVAAFDLPAGHVLTQNDIAIKSPSDGLPPYELENMLGKKLLRPLKEDENLLFQDVGAA